MATPLDTVTRHLYAQAALSPDATLCCVGSTPWRLPGLAVPAIMHEMNYGCGTTVQPQDIPDAGSILYLGAGGGLELLQFAYHTRRRGAVVGLDVVPEMLVKCHENLAEAARLNPWFDPAFVDLREGDARAVPLADESVDLVGQNCLFNIFETDMLEAALREAHRVLRSGGRLVLSDPICETSLPEALRANPQLRAACLSGAIPLADYVDRLVATGFGTIEVRSRRPYRALTPDEHGVDEMVLLETVEVAAFKAPVPDDGPCVFTGRTAVYLGPDEEFDDGHGHVLRRNIPLGVCDKTAGQLENIEGIVTTPSTWHYPGDGCC